MKLCFWVILYCHAEWFSSGSWRRGSTGGLVTFGWLTGVAGLPLTLEASPGSFPQDFGWAFNQCVVRPQLPVREYMLGGDVTSIYTKAGTHLGWEREIRHGCIQKGMGYKWGHTCVCQGRNGASLFLLLYP